MIIKLRKAQLKKLHDYLKDEKKDHPSVWSGIQAGMKSKNQILTYEVTPKEKGLINKILSIKNPLKKELQKFGMDNNESFTIGIAQLVNGEFLALTPTKSKRFKTKAGATKWFLKHGGIKASEMLKNPSERTKLLRKAKKIPKNAWLGGNQYGPSSTHSKTPKILPDEWIGHNQYQKGGKKSKKHKKS